MTWIVKLVETPKVNDFRDDYFPRKFALKSAAMALVKEVQWKGGVAVIEKDKGGSTEPTPSLNDRMRKGQVTVQEMASLLAKFKSSADVLLSRNTLYVRQDNQLYHLDQPPPSRG